MGGADEFFWVTNAEPHHSRRRAILDKYGDKVRALYGYDHSTAVQVQSPPKVDWRSDQHRLAGNSNNLPLSVAVLTNQHAHGNPCKG